MSDPLADAIEAVLLDVRAHYKHHPSARTEAHALAHAIRDGSLAHVFADVPPEALGFEQLHRAHKVDLSEDGPLGRCLGAYYTTATWINAAEYQGHRRVQKEQE